MGASQLSSWRRGCSPGWRPLKGANAGTDSGGSSLTPAEWVASTVNERGERV